MVNDTIENVTQWLSENKTIIYQYEVALLIVSILVFIVICSLYRWLIKGSGPCSRSEKSQSSVWHVLLNKLNILKRSKER